MPVRSSMANLIARVRILINDQLPLNQGQVFTDQQIQDAMDETREDVRYEPLNPAPTYSGTTIQYLDYYVNPGNGNLEDDVTLWQYRIVSVTPSTSENIVGHWQFAETTLPPVFALGKRYDIYRCAADLLERRAAIAMLNYGFSADGQSVQRQQVLTMMLDLAHNYRLKQKPMPIASIRSDIGSPQGMDSLSLGPTEIDYIGSGDGR